MTEKTLREKKIRRYTYDEWKAEGKRLFGNSIWDWLYVCPMCGHVQGAHEFAERTEIKKDDYHKYIGFSCIGRYLKYQKPLPGQDEHAFPVKMKGGGCNWTLGGLFNIHNAEVVKDDGIPISVFEFYEGKKKCQKKK